MKYQSPNPYNVKVGQKVKVKVTRSKFMVSNERSGHEVSICEIPKPYYLLFKSRSKGQSQGHKVKSHCIK